MTYIEPLLLICCAGALAAMLTDSPKRKYLSISGVLAILLISWPPLDWLMALPLVARYPVRPFEAVPGTQAIVVLGSAVTPPQYERPYPRPDTETFNRCEHAAWIYRERVSVPVLACEGRQRGARAAAMRDLLRRGGIPEIAIWVEHQSLSTHENALYGASILREHGIQRIVLVVDAQSMLRASACFRKLGFDVMPAPSDFRTLGPWKAELLPQWSAVRRNEITLHEVLGLAWYRLRGWI
jgi:uncharacterized SAM-binding protein YcdF (DUF218 family)